MNLTEKWSAASLSIHGQLGALACHCWPFVLSSGLNSSQRNPLATLRELQVTVKKFSGRWCPEDVKISPWLLYHADRFVHTLAAAISAIRGIELRKAS